MRLLTTTLAITLATIISVSASAVPYHHMHLTAPDPGAAAQWYAKHFNGTDAKGDRCMIGDTYFIFFKKDAGFPGSVGSAVDHIGFSVTDIEAAMSGYEAAGVKILSGVREIQSLKIAFIEDPWGTKIEIVQDTDLLGFHHIHLHSPDAAATAKWYQDVFGGEAFESFKGLPIRGVDYGSVLLMVQQSAEEKAPTKGRSIDHLGWSTSTLKADHERLTAAGVTFSLKPTPYRNLHISFINGPDGVNIEYLQPASE